MFAEISGAIGLVRQLLAVKGMKDNMEAMVALTDLGVRLAEVQDRLATMMTENRDLRDEVDRLKRELQEAKNPSLARREDGLLYKSNGEGPFCPVCYGQSGKLIPMQALYTGAPNEVTGWSCHPCKKPFYKPGKGYRIGVASD